MIMKSGGAIRDLFFMLMDAAILELTKEHPQTITDEDANIVAKRLKSTYERFIISAAQFEHLVQVHNDPQPENKDEAWICRLYSNYAACCIRRGDYQKAQSISEMCLSMLTERGQMNPERETRVRMNLMICQIERGKKAEIYTGAWQEYLDKIKAEPGTGTINYASCLLMDAWYRSVLLGANKEALAEAKEALEKNRFLLEENSYDLAVNYAVLEKIYNQMGDAENEKLTSIKKTNILRTCRNPYQTRD